MDYSGPFFFLFRPIKETSYRREKKLGTIPRQDLVSSVGTHTHTGVGSSVVTGRGGTYGFPLTGWNSYADIQSDTLRESFPPIGWSSSIVS